MSRFAFPADRRTRRVLVFVGLALILALFVLFIVEEVYSTEGLFSYDPYYHMHLAKITAEREGIVTVLPTMNSAFRPNYLSGMIPLTAMIHRLTGISLMSVYRNLGWISRLFTVILIFMGCELMMGDDGKAPLLSTLAFLASPYVLRRSIITFPENLAVAFHAGLFYAMVRSWKSRRTSPMVPLFFVASLYVHYMSSLIPILLLTLFLLSSKKLKSAVFVLLTVVLLLLPITPYIYRQYRAYLTVNVGPEATWKPHAKGPAYEVPNVEHYQNNLGIGLFLFSILGLASIIAQPSKEGLAVAAWLTFALILSRGKQFGLYVPTDRMMMYLALPSAYSSSFAFRRLSDLTFKRMFPRMFFAFLVPLLMTVLFLQGLYGLQGWVGIGPELRQATDMVNRLAASGAAIVPVNADWFTMGIEDYDQIYGIPQREWRRILHSPEGAEENLRAKLGEREIIVVVKDHPLIPPGAEPLFEGKNVKIYRYPGV